MIDRDRSYVATLTADGAPLANTNVMMSSKDAETTSSGMTDASGVTSGLSFSIYDLDASGTLTDYSAYYNTYSLSTVAMVSYGYTSETVNDGDFRYLQGQPTLVDAPVDTQNGVNAASYALVTQSTCEFVVQTPVMLWLLHVMEHSQPLAAEVSLTAWLSMGR